LLSPEARVKAAWHGRPWTIADLLRPGVVKCNQWLKNWAATPTALINFADIRLPLCSAEGRKCAKINLEWDNANGIPKAEPPNSQKPLAGPGQIQKMS
jgi:hypothetical protein